MPVETEWLSMTFNCSIYAPFQCQFSASLILSKFNTKLYYVPLKSTNTLAFNLSANYISQHRLVFLFTNGGCIEPQYNKTSYQVQRLHFLKFCWVKKNVEQNKDDSLVARTLPEALEKLVWSSPRPVSTCPLSCATEEERKKFDEARLSGRQSSTTDQR